MSKTIYIGDIHGRDVWEEIVEKHDNADHIVFIGDYFDSSLFWFNLIMVL